MDTVTWVALGTEKGDRRRRPWELPELERLEAWEDLGFLARDMRGSMDRNESGGVGDVLGDILTGSAIFNVRMRAPKSGAG